MIRTLQCFCRYLGFKKTILLNRKLLVDLIDQFNNGVLNWVEFSSTVKEAHANRIGSPTKRLAIPDRPKEEDYFYSNPEECLEPSDEHLSSTWVMCLEDSGITCSLSWCHSVFYQILRLVSAQFSEDSLLYQRDSQWWLLMGIELMKSQGGQAKQLGHILYIIFANNSSHPCIEATLPLRRKSYTNLDSWNCFPGWSLIHWYLFTSIFLYIIFCFLVMLAFYPPWSLFLQAYTRYKICAWVDYFFSSSSFWPIIPGMIDWMIN